MWILYWVSMVVCLITIFRNSKYLGVDRYFFFAIILSLIPGLNTLLALYAVVSD
jgi:hypothetical protein